MDEITNGGLPRRRPTLVCGGAGSGKTLLAMEFIVWGIRDYGEPGVFVAFEETAEDLTKNVACLGFDLDELIRRRQLAVDYVRVERSEIEETGEYDLEGIFIRLDSTIQEVGAKQVAIDTIETLFAGLLNAGILRAGWACSTGICKTTRHFGPRSWKSCSAFLPAPSRGGLRTGPSGCIPRTFRA